MSQKEILLCYRQGRNFIVPGPTRNSVLGATQSNFDAFIIHIVLNIFLYRFVFCFLIYIENLVFCFNLKRQKNNNNRKKK